MGGIVGSIWGLVIDSTNMANLAYYSGVSNKEVCSMPSKQTFKCQMYKNGTLVGNV